MARPPRSEGRKANRSRTSGQDPVARLRAICLALPEANEFHVAYRDRPNDSSAFLESNVVIVQVMPVPSDQAEALAAYSSDLALLAQFDPRWSYLAPAVTHKAAEFLDRFPNSPYAYYVRRGLHRALRDRVVGNRATREERELYERLQAEKAANP